MSSINILKSISLLDVVEEGEKRFVCINRKNVVSDFLNGLIKPFLVAYWLVGQFIINGKSFPYEDSRLPLELQLFSASVLHLGITDASESLSLQTLKNGITTYKLSGCLRVQNIPSNGNIVVGVNKEKLHSFVSRLGTFAGLPNIWLVVGADGKAKIKAKL